ncbi:LMBR1-domain-containing protein [Rhizoclosmatium globosum]|uniref:LMBR1-domain-containing protein n=1 Tax=Rhizoclosmatium globosum TaxID=329046 RepID=A0A1Y2C345_9FUNG|nr:LMBR1-domain-containing protein [Rhizoclosmatium globosum]|eukprot:ORY40735.1 LMBR1-domain-containing protein [Rhizoclosmatium globosum]
MILAILLLVVLAVFVAALLVYFGNIKQFSWYSSVFSFVGWFFPFSIVLILPLDLASTLHSRCLADNSDGDLSVCEEPLAFVERDFLWTFWTFVYWTSQLLCWFVIPVMGTYVRSGDFRFSARLVNAVKDNLFYYLLMAVGGIAFLIYMLVAVKFTKEDLIVVLMAAANAWGLLLCTCMLGYGLVEVPRDVWNSALPAQRLKALEMKAPKARETMIDSEAAMYQVARDIASANHKVPDGDPLRVHVELLLKKCPLALDERVQNDIDRRKEVTELTLRDLHAHLKYNQTLVTRHTAQYRFLLEKAWFLGDVVQNQSSKDYIFRSVFFKTSATPTDLEIAKLRVLWFWYVWIKPILIRVFSVIFILASIALIWSESTFQITALPLSIPALLLKNNVVSYASLEFIAISFLVYMCICAYSTLFKINLFDYYVIVPEHCTDEPSMLFMGGYLCRLTFPLCYNFLHMVADDENSVFIEFQGKSIDLAPLLGEGFNDWVPLLVLIVSVITYFDLFGRISGFCCMGRKLVKGRNEEHEADAIEGRSIIAQARSAEERKSGGGFTSSPERLKVGAGAALNTKDLLAKYGRSGTGVGAQGGAGSSSTAPVGAAGRPGSNSNILATSAATPPSSAPATVTSSASAWLKGFGFGATSTSTSSKPVGKYHKLGDEEGEALIEQPVVQPTASASNNVALKLFAAEPAKPATTRVFGTNSATASPSLSRQATPSPISTPAPPPKKRNMFDDL